MGIEIGDSVAVDGKAGEVVDFLDGRAVVRPFPIAEQADWPGPPNSFVAHGETTLIKKYWDRETSFDRKRDQLAARARQRSEELRAAYYERAGRADRAWHRERG